MRTNCVNCGAPVQLNQCACPWCNTPYRVPQEDTLTITMDRFDIDTNVLHHLLTPNEIRKRMFLERD